MRWGREQCTRHARGVSAIMCPSWGDEGASAGKSDWGWWERRGSSRRRERLVWPLARARCRGAIARVCWMAKEEAPRMKAKNQGFGVSEGSKECLGTEGHNVCTGGVWGETMERRGCKGEWGAGPPCRVLGCVGAVIGGGGGRAGGAAPASRSLSLSSRAPLGAAHCVAKVGQCPGGTATVPPTTGTWPAPVRPRRARRRGPTTGPAPCPAAAGPCARLCEMAAGQAEEGGRVS